MNEEKFKIKFWKQFNKCSSEDEFANLLAWIYFQVEDGQYYDELPYNAAVAEVWKACPSAVNKFIEQGGSSLPALMMVTVRGKLKDMTTNELMELKEEIAIDNILLLN